MTSSLVGSEMCIRDRRECGREGEREGRKETGRQGDNAETGRGGRGYRETCLLYTSDAADDM
eukprot:12464066-Prorocentrum_lima.AAC.1